MGDAGAGNTVVSSPTGGSASRRGAGHAAQHGHLQLPRPGAAVHRHPVRARDPLRRRRVRPRRDAGAPVADVGRHVAEPPPAGRVVVVAAPGAAAAGPALPAPAAAAAVRLRPAERHARRRRHAAVLARVRVVGGGGPDAAAEHPGGADDARQQARLHQQHQWLQHWLAKPAARPLNNQGN
jgi:hypothetical protein